MAIKRISLEQAEFTAHAMASKAKAKLKGK